MKKPTTLAQQVRDAQKTVSSWSLRKQESTRLEGSDIYLKKGIASSRGKANVQQVKKG
jgi:hypothetical protein